MSQREKKAEQAIFFPLCCAYSKVNRRPRLAFFMSDDLALFYACKTSRFRGYMCICDIVFHRPERTLSASDFDENTKCSLRSALIGKKKKRFLFN